MDLLHRSAGGVMLLSACSWSIHRLLGRRGRRLQPCSGRWIFTSIMHRITLPSHTPFLLQLISTC